MTGTRTRPRIRRASRQRAHALLSAAVAAGRITGFEALPRPDRRWMIEVPSTRREHYNDPEGHGVIALSTREVLAFIEGCWAAAKVHPTTRAGHDQNHDYLEG